MASPKLTLRSVFPHIAGAAIDNIVDGLSGEFQGQPDRLLSRATSELLRGNFPAALDGENGGVEVVDVDAAAPKPDRDLELEKVEILAFVEGMAPNVDMKWLSSQYETLKLNGDKRLRARDHIQGLLANHVLENPDYPKKPAPAEKVVVAPTDYSKFDKLITSADYRTQCLEQIQQDFRWLTLPSLRDVLQRYHYHYFPTYKFITTDLTVSPTMTQRLTGEAGDKPASATDLKMLSKPRQARDVDLMDPALVDEYIFTHKEEREKQEEADKLARQAKEDEEAEKAGNVFECGCCYVDVPMTRMVQCAEGHLFCTDCLKQYVEESAFSSGQTTVHCLDESGCKANFPMAQLLRAIPAQKLDKIFARMADLDIKKAGLENVHGCPHCDFQMEIPNPDEKLFKCQNPECLKESCLLCKEPNHIPLRCEEVEKAGVTDYRKKVEEAMTASLVRTCPKCKAKFFKTEGCNKMTCSCGAHVCYVCREIIKGKDAYGHFCKHDRGPREFGACPDCKKCFLFLRSTEDADKQLVEAAKTDATKEFAGDNAELAAVQVGAKEPEPKKGAKGKKKKAAAGGGFMPQMNVAMPFGFGVPNLAQMHQNFMGHINQMMGRGAARPALPVNHFGRIVQPAPPMPLMPPPAPVVIADLDLAAPKRLKRKASSGLGAANQPIDVDDEQLARRLHQQWAQEDAQQQLEARRQQMYQQQLQRAAARAYYEEDEEEDEDDYDRDEEDSEDDDDY